MNFERQYGFQSVRIDDSITAGTPQLAVTCPTGARLILRRVWGSSAYDVILKQGTTAGAKTAIDIPTIQSQDNFDVPGLFVWLPLNNNLYVDVGASGAPDIQIQYGIAYSNP